MNQKILFGLSKYLLSLFSAGFGILLNVTPVHLKSSLVLDRIDKWKTYKVTTE